MHVLASFCSLCTSYCCCAWVAAMGSKQAPGPETAAAWHNHAGSACTSDCLRVKHGQASLHPASTSLSWSFQTMYMSSSLRNAGLDSRMPACCSLGCASRSCCRLDTVSRLKRSYLHQPGLGRGQADTADPASTSCFEIQSRQDCTTFRSQTPLPSALQVGSTYTGRLLTLPSVKPACLARLQPWSCHKAACYAAASPVTICDCTVSKPSVCWQAFAQGVAARMTIIS